MRLRHYVAAEIAVLLLGATGIVLAARRAPDLIAWATREAAGRTASVREPEHVAYPPRGELTPPPDPPAVMEPGGTFLGMSDDLLLRRVRTQPIVGLKVQGGGSTLSFRADLADGSRAFIKPAQTNLRTVPRKEVAAYRLARLLGFSGVPPAAPRLLSREEIVAHLRPESRAALPRIDAETLFDPLGRTAAMAQYWVPGLAESGLDTPDGRRASFGWLTAGQPIPQDKRPLAAQLSDLIVFDFLAANPDRYSGGNLKMSADGSRLYAIDNTLAFFLAPDGLPQNRELLERTQRFSRRLRGALERMSPETLRAALDAERDSPYEILTEAEAAAVLSRRDAVRRYMDALASRLGEPVVFVFP